MRYFIYIHTCPNGKKYIGVTTHKPEYRWNNGKGYKRNEHFYQAIQKYGWDNIDHKVFETVSESTMFFWEKILIHYYKSNDKRYGYNNSYGGEGGNIGYKMTSEQRKKCGRKKGYKVSDETREKISNAKLGHITTEDTKRKISESSKGRISPRKGVKLSDETKVKISNGCKNYFYTKKNKKNMSD